MNEIGMAGTAAQHPAGLVSCNLNSMKIGNDEIDIAVQFFGDTPFIIVTQFQKIGSLFHISPDAPVPGDQSMTSYHIRVLMGESKPEMIAFCEILAKKMSLSTGSMIFALSLHDKIFKDAAAIKEIMNFVTTMSTLRSTVDRHV